MRAFMRACGHRPRAHGGTISKSYVQSSAEEYLQVGVGKVAQVVGWRVTALASHVVGERVGA
eukprot:COSAG02_NODE_2910_length_7766_cov_5.844659_1_plen_62_part_00